MTGTRRVGTGPTGSSVTHTHGSKIGTDIVTGQRWTGMLRTEGVLHTGRRCEIMHAKILTKHSVCTSRCPTQHGHHQN
eukprot:4846577-Karenia_brevis.AAC.1